LDGEGDEIQFPDVRGLQHLGQWAAFVFLAAPSCSSYITGEILPIIGGYLGG
jgi:hypothetical protein